MFLYPSLAFFVKALRSCTLAWLFISDNITELTISLIIFLENLHLESKFYFFKVKVYLFCESNVGFLTEQFIKIQRCDFIRSGSGSRLLSFFFTQWPSFFLLVILNHIVKIDSLPRIYSYLGQMIDLCRIALCILFWLSICSIVHICLTIYIWCSLSGRYTSMAAIARLILREAPFFEKRPCLSISPYLQISLFT